MDILPDYLIIESLGTVSGKSFYWARRKSDNTVVLIKQSTTMHLFDDEINQLKQECKTAELIGYKATLRLPDTQNGHCAIIYESCDGVFLNRLLETQSLSIDEKIHLFKVAAKSLNELQKKNIIHFGIRLDTTLLRNNNEETLFFSLGDTAILNEGETFFPGNHHYTLDVLKYLPPELTGKIYATVDLRTSFYQLGIMFYYIFTGRFPFESSIPEKLLYAQAFEKPTEPHVIKQEVPEWISAIIMKLLEKKPDDRYQTATAICFDLENFNPEIKFIPGAKDCGHFKLTRKLFGYHAQLEELNWYNKHISLAETRVVFMKCEEGCGKKAFLENVNEMVNKSGGYYFNIDFSPVSGKFPFHGILILLNQIITRIKIEDKDSKFIEFLKSEKDVKAYLQQFATLFPELKNIYPHDKDKESDNDLVNVHFRHYFFYLTARILYFFTENFGTLTIYASGLNSKMEEELKIIRYLLSRCCHLMFLLPISEDDRANIKKKLDLDNVFFAEISLPVLSKTDASRLIAASFHCNTSETLLAADVLIQKSGGKLDIMKYILQSWYKKGIISYSDSRLHFDIDSASNFFVPNISVVNSLLQNKTGDSIKFIQLLSCFPTGVENLKIGKILKLKTSEIYKILNDCKNFIVQRNGYIYFQHEEERHFIYTNIPEHKLKDFHSLIVLDFIQSGTTEDFSFTMIDHVFFAFENLNEEQRQFLLDLFIRVIEKANFTAAFEYGFQLCCKVVDLYGYEKLSRYKDECHFYCLATIHSFFSKNYEMMLDFYNHLNIEKYNGNYEKLEVQEYVAEYFQQIGQIDEAIELCVSALQKLGFTVPTNVSTLTLRRKQYLLKKKLQNLNDFEKKPEMVNPEDILIMRYLAKMIPIIFFLRKKDAIFLTCKMVDFTLEHGKSFISPFAFALYGSLLVKEQHNFEDGVFLAQTALAMLDEIKGVEFVSQTIFFAVFFAAHWKLSHDQIHSWINRAVNYENDYGCSTFGIVCNNILPLYSCFSGMHLKQILTTVNCRVNNFFDQSINNPTAYLHNISLEVIKSLSDGSERMWSILPEIYRIPQSAKEHFFVGYYYTLELFLAVLEEKTDVISECVIEKKQFYPFFAENYLYQAMLLKLAIVNGTISKKSGLQKIRKIANLLKRCRDNGAENLEIKSYILCGILAELNNNSILSNKWYYEALEESVKKENYLDAGLCALLLIKQQLHNGDKIVASVYFKKAIQFFSSLGYSGVTNYLKTRYEIQLEDKIILKNIEDTTNENEIFDSFIKELNAVSNVADLIHNFIRQVAFLFQTDICLAISFDKGGKPVISAMEHKIYNNEIAEGMSLSDINAEKFPKYLISFVCDNGCSVNLNDKKWHNIVFYDRYLKKYKPRNVFCIPLFESKDNNADKIEMVLYLETLSQKQIFSAESELLLQKLFKTYLSCRDRLQLSIGKKNIHSEKIKLLKQKNKELQKKYKELTYLQEQGILKFDLQGKITYCNSIGCKMLGLETKILKDGFFLTELFSCEKDKIGGCANIERLLKYNFGGPYEYEWGNKCFVRVVWTTCKDKGNNIVGGKAIFINITKQKQNETRLRKINEQQEELITKRTESLNESLLQLRRSQNQLIQTEKMTSLKSVIIGISHEINTPLGIAITSASILRDSFYQFNNQIKKSDISKKDFQELYDNTQDSLSMISNNLESIAALINNFKVILQEQSENELCQFDLRNYLNMIYQTQKARFKNIAHEFILDCPTPFLINSYPDVFFKIISNLILNSFIHGFDKRNNCVINISVSMENDETVKLVYKDTGHGIPQENLDKIFNPFFTTKTGKGEKGLGLYIVYNLVMARLKGTIQCNSSLDDGATFIITFPNIASREATKNDNNQNSEN